MSDTPLPPDEVVGWLKARVAYLEAEVARLREVEREIERLRREAAQRAQPQD